MPKPLVTLLVLNWNGKGILEECLDSVRNLTYSPVEIVVVDNASTDGSEKTAGRFKNVRLIRNDRNVGFAAGNNVGFKHARGKYVATLNNDIVVEPDWLENAVPFMEQDPRVGIISSRQMSYQNRDMIDGLYHVLTPRLVFEAFAFNRKYRRERLMSEPGYVFGAGGASAIWRKQLLDECGGFDERFYAYHEDADLCMRAFLAGWKCVYAPDAVVYHKGSMSFGKGTVSSRYYYERNRLLFMYKYFPLHLIIRNFPWIFVMEARVARALCKVKMASVYFRARMNALSLFREYRHARVENLRRLRQYRGYFDLLRKEKKLAPGTA